jgi:hypothetical protein
MDLKAALEKEIQTIDTRILESLEFAEKEQDLIYGRSTRHVLRNMKASYSRILTSLNEESKG